jgi:AcrR family transcriptional regulator
MVLRNKVATRAHLLQTARRMVIDGGLKALRVNALAKRARVDKVLIYRYFESIEGVFLAVAQAEELWPRWAWFEETYFKTIPPGESLLVETYSNALRGFVEGIWSRPLSLRLFGEAVGAIDPNPLYVVYVTERENFEYALLQHLENSGIPLVGRQMFPVIASGIIYQYLSGRLEHPSHLAEYCRQAAKIVS